MTDLQCITLSRNGPNATCGANSTNPTVSLPCPCTFVGLSDDIVPRDRCDQVCQDALKENHDEQTGDKKAGFFLSQNDKFFDGAPTSGLATLTLHGDDNFGDV